jgi:hypothetical protein
VSPFDHDQENSSLSKTRQMLLDKLKKGHSATRTIQPRTSANIIPLSHAQQRIWFLEPFIPNTALSVYNCRCLSTQFSLMQASAWRSIND